MKGLTYFKCERIAPRKSGKKYKNDASNKYRRTESKNMEGLSQNKESRSKIKRIVLIPQGHRKYLYAFAYCQCCCCLIYLSSAKCAIAQIYLP